MAENLRDDDIEPDGKPDRVERTAGGCMPVAAILLLAILVIAAALVWLRSRHDAPNPALSGHPPSLPAR